MKNIRNTKKATSFMAIALCLGLFGCSAPDTVGHKSISLFTSVSLNSGNPYDSIGQEHNIALQYALSQMDSTAPEGPDTLAYKEIIATTMLNPYFGNRYGITGATFGLYDTMAVHSRTVHLPNFFDTITTATGLTAKEVSYNQRMGVAMAIAKANGAYMDSILAIETSVVNDTWATGENHVQKMISVAKWSCDFWSNEVSSLWISRLGGHGSNPCDCWLEDDEEGCELGSLFGPGGAILGGVLFSVFSPEDAY